MILSWFLVLQSAFALVSPFPSEVEGLNIPNSHYVEQKEGTLVRGMRPRTVKDITELMSIGITDVVIFKDSSLEDKSTEEEILMLQDAGVSRKNINVIPFKWKDIDNFETACLQTIEALKLMKDVSENKDRGLFFHCTVGEDRTGYLAAMYRILYQNADPKDVYLNEMCENGYADGNPGKPKHVAQTVRNNVGVVFEKMLHKIQYGFISGTNLDKTECSFDPERSKRYKFKKKFKKCKPSSKYDPTIE